MYKRQSRKWRIRHDDGAWGALDFSVGADKDTSALSTEYALRLNSDRSADFAGDISLGDNDITNVGVISLDKIQPDSSNIVLNMATDKNISFSGGIGEIGNVTGFQALNDAGSALTDFGIRATTIRFATGSAERLRVQDDKVMLSVDLKPDTTNQRDFGTNGNRFKDAYFAGTVTACLLYTSPSPRD